MKTRSLKLDWLTPAVVAAVILWPDTTDAAQRFVAVSAALSAGPLSIWSDRFVWSPLINKAGFWRSSILLVGALITTNAVIMFLAARAAGLPPLAFKLPVTVLSTVLLFGWGLAAIRNAQNRASSHPAATA